MVVLNNAIWIFGGILRSGLRSNGLWKFHVDKGIWQHLKSDELVPTERSGHGMTAIEKENKKIVFGGRKAENAEGDLNDLWEYNVRENCWDILNPGEAPTSPIKMTFKQVGMMSSIVSRFRRNSAKGLKA